MNQKFLRAVGLISFFSLAATFIVTNRSNPDPVQARPISSPVSSAPSATVKEPPPIKSQRPVVVKERLLGEQAKEAPGSRFNTELNIQGKLIYAFDNARYGAAGFAWPWNSYLVLRYFGKVDRREDERKITSYEVETPEHDFLYEPQFSPNGEYTLFKIGDPTSSFGTYHPYILHLKTQRLQPIPVARQGLSYRPTFWSRDSRYIAYIQGAISPPVGGATPAELHIYDMITGQERMIVKNDAVLGSVAWTPENTLLYSVLPDTRRSQSVQEGALAKTEENIAHVSPDIYEVPAAGGQPKLLIRNGFRPSVSPDGRRVAFVGATDPDKPQNPSSGYPFSQDSQLLLSSRTGKERIIIRPAQNNDYSILRWTSDSRYLIAITCTPKSDDIMQARITEFEISTMKERHITTIEYADKFRRELGDDASLFRPLTLSRDGTKLYFELLQFSTAGTHESGLFLKALSLGNGKVDTVARVGSVRRLDWHDESE